LASCPIEPPKTVYVSCWDGSQVEEGNECPTQIQCWDGSTVADASSCPATPPPPPQVVYDPCSEGDLNFVVYFPWDKSTLTEQARSVILNATNTANQCNVNGIVIEGHADSSGSQSYNIGLSERRANIVENEVHANGVSTTNVVKSAKGETELAVATGDGVREPLNRRSEVVIRLLPSSSLVQ
jgi:outer membrane protein OmpA-like peptidoglycan-associated protein